MERRQIVLDTNVLIAALRSRRGASFRLLSLVGTSSAFELNLSVPLVLEYEEVAKRPGLVVGLSAEEVDAVIDYLCSVSNRREVFFLWRPFLKDPKDDMVLELAVAAGADTIVTFNQKDFAGSETFGLRAVTPQVFLQEIGEQ